MNVLYDSFITGASYGLKFLGVFLTIAAVLGAVHGLFVFTVLARKLFLYTVTWVRVFFTGAKVPVVKPPRDKNAWKDRARKNTEEG